MALHKNALAYSATSLGASMMNSIFLFYYVKLFLDKYHVSESWFHISQVIYMIWNAINDPLFAYFQDQSKWEFCRSRQKAILYGGPVWALCFLLPWFRWAGDDSGDWVTGLHLIVTLCAYDALLTFVLLSQCALFAEMSVQHEDRLRLIKYSQIAYVMGNSSVFLSGIFSQNMENMFGLQVFCLIVAVAATFCLRYSGKHSKTQYDAETQEVLSKQPSSGDQKGKQDEMSFKGAWLITWQILRNKNFITFVIMNFFQVLHSTIGSNFMLIFADHLIPKDVLPSMARSAVYGASFVLPQIIILSCGGILAKFGYYRVIMSSFFMQICLGLLVYMMGREHYYLLAVFFILDMSIPSASFSLFNISLSDIIDEDMVINNVKLPRSSMVFGTNALITKPAQSIAPMVIVTILNRYGYEALKEYGIPGVSIPTDITPPDAVQVADLHSVMFNLMCFVPIVFSVLQIISWSMYKLTNTHDTQAKYVDM